MSKALITLGVLLVVGMGAFFLLSASQEPTLNGNVVSEGDEGSVSAAAGGEVKTFVVTGENFKFVVDGVDNPDIVVNQGDRVRIEFSSTQGFHDWVVDEFNAATEKVRDTDGSTFVEFVAEDVGTFEYYCSVGQHRANGMWGNLIVE